LCAYPARRRPLACPVASAHRRGGKRAPSPRPRTRARLARQTPHHERLTMVSPIHVHLWGSDRGCRRYFVVAGKAVRCAARKCRLDECDAKALPHLDVCARHRAVAFSLVKVER
jgi:hypothetical protein